MSCNHSLDSSPSWSYRAKYKPFTADRELNNSLNCILYSIGILNSIKLCLIVDETTFFQANTYYVRLKIVASVELNVCKIR